MDNMPQPSALDMLSGKTPKKKIKVVNLGKKKPAPKGKKPVPGLVPPSKKGK